MIKTVKTAITVIKDGKPSCPCGSYQFDVTFLLKAGNWKIDYVYCHKCDSKIEVTPEFEDYIRKEKWNVTTAVKSW